MQKYQDVVLNQNGNPVSGVQVTVTDLLGTPVSVYSSNAIGLNVNPLTSDNNGRFSFYAPDGRYSLSFSFGGNVVASITDILLEDPMDGSDAVFNDVTILGELSDASKITSTAVGGLSATNVQDALAELDGEKASNADLSLKVNSADLAANGGAALVGYDDGTAQDVLDDAKPMANYTALRAYTGRATGVRITQAGLAGFFQRDDADTTSADNGGTIIVDASGRRWKRLFVGPVKVRWFGVKADWNGSTGTDDTAGLQAALNSGYGAVELAEGTSLFSTLTVPGNISVFGSTTRRSILRHTGAGVAISCVYSSTPPDGLGDYIDSGWFDFHDFELLVNGTVGFSVGKTRSTFTNWERIYMRHLQDGGTYAPGTTAILCDNSPWIASYSTYIEKLNTVYVRGFESGVSLNATVNAWELNRVFMINVKNQLVLNGATGINVNGCYFESNLSGAMGIVFGAAGGNNINVNNSSFELTHADALQYAYDFSAGGVWEQITVVSTKYLLAGDGNAVNNRRIKGTAPLSFVEVNRTYTNTTLSKNLPMIWAPGAAANQPFQMPNYARFGGVPGGNGRVILARNGTDAADGYIENDGTYGLTFAAPGTGNVCDFKWQDASGNAMLTYKSYTTPAFASGRDNNDALGLSSKRWSVVYAGTGTINTSDAREKQQIRELSDAERAVAVRLKSMIRAFKFNDAVRAKGEKARIHFGAIAQDVKAAFEAEGLVAEDYAILCFDEWDEQAEVLGDDGNVTSEYRPAGNRYGVRYEELLAFIISAL